MLCPASTVSRFVPSRSISASSPACDDADSPRIATIAAVPIAIPSADSAARSGRDAQPDARHAQPVLQAQSETTWPSSIRIWRGS